MNALLKIARLGRTMGEAGLMGAGLGFGISKLKGYPTEAALANALASAGLSAGATGAINLPAHLRHKRYLKELEQQEKTASIASAIGELPTHEKAMLGAGAAGVAGGLGGLTYLAHKYPGVAYPISYGILGGKVGGRAGWKMGPRDDHEARQASAAAGGTLGALAGIRAGRTAGKKYIEERDRKKRLKEQQGQEKTAMQALMKIAKSSQISRGLHALEKYQTGRTLGALGGALATGVPAQLAEGAGADATAMRLLATGAGALAGRHMGGRLARKSIEKEHEKKK
jgi:hypothetical protein